MRDSRKYSRFDVGFECHLKKTATGGYKALLDDLSFGGARVLMDDVTPFGIGDLCELALNGNQVDVSIIHNCTVIWIDCENGKIGLSFIP
jgi:c-di-GMP-binding flagellar brake protein YcgR